MVSIDSNLSDFLSVGSPALQQGRKHSHVSSLNASVSLNGGGDLVRR